MRHRSCTEGCYRNLRKRTSGLRIFPANVLSCAASCIQFIIAIIIVSRVNKLSKAGRKIHAGPGVSTIGTSSVLIIYIRSKLVLRLVLINVHKSSVTAHFFFARAQACIGEFVKSVVLRTTQKIIRGGRMYGTGIKLFDAKTFIAIAEGLTTIS